MSDYVNAYPSPNISVQASSMVTFAEEDQQKADTKMMQTLDILTIELFRIITEQSEHLLLINQPL